MSAKDFARVLREHVRLTMLRAMAEVPAQGSNESTLTQFVNLLHPGTTRDQIRSEMTWLGEQGLLRVEEVGELMVATITKRGVDVAKGHSRIPGVAKPSAED